MQTPLRRKSLPLLAVLPVLGGCAQMNFDVMSSSAEVTFDDLAYACGLPSLEVDVNDPLRESDDDTLTVAQRRLLQSYARHMQTERRIAGLQLEYDHREPLQAELPGLVDDARALLAETARFHAETQKWLQQDQTDYRRYRALKMLIEAEVSEAGGTHEDALLLADLALALYTRRRLNPTEVPADWRPTLEALHRQEVDGSVWRRLFAALDGTVPAAAEAAQRMDDGGVSGVPEEDAWRAARLIRRDIEWFFDTRRLVVQDPTSRAGQLDSTAIGVLRTVGRLDPDVRHQAGIRARRAAVAVLANAGFDPLTGAGWPSSQAFTALLLAEENLLDDHRDEEQRRRFQNQLVELFSGPSELDQLLDDVIQARRQSDARDASEQWERRERQRQRPLVQAALDAINTHGGVEEWEGSKPDFLVMHRPLQLLHTRVYWNWVDWRDRFAEPSGSACLNSDRPAPASGCTRRTSLQSYAKSEYTRGHPSGRGAVAPLREAESSKTGPWEHSYGLNRRFGELGFYASGALIWHDDAQEHRRFIEYLESQYALELPNLARDILAAQRDYQAWLPAELDELAALCGLDTAGMPLDSGRATIELTQVYARAGSNYFDPDNPAGDDSVDGPEPPPPGPSDGPSGTYNGVLTPGTEGDDASFLNLGPLGQTFALDVTISGNTIQISAPGVFVDVGGIYDPLTNSFRDLGATENSPWRVRADGQITEINGRFELTLTYIVSTPLSGANYFYQGSNP